MSSRHQNILFTHSGGVTSVVNSIAYQIYKRARQYDKEMFIARYGIDGILQANYINSQNITSDSWEKIAQSPSSCFGSSRTRLPNDIAGFKPIFDYMDKKDIRVFFCNGGNNSQLVTQRMYQAATLLGYPLQCIGIPKTIDNDILHTDTCPGFGSAAKYTVSSLCDISMDVKAMCKSSTNVLIYESMGRGSGWLAASSALATLHGYGPHIILLPEASFTIQDVINRTQATLNRQGYCIIVIAEGALDKEKKLNTNSHKSIQLNHYLNDALSIKSRIVIPDYLQRSSRILASKTDIDQAKALADHAFNLALEGQNAIMTTIVRESTEPYHWLVSSVALSEVAGKVKMLPDSYLSEDQLFVSDQCIQFLRPLIKGECFPNFKSGIPDYHLLMEQ